MASQRKAQDLEAQMRDIRKQLNDQIGSLEFRTEAKISLLNELQDFFKRRSEVEMEYTRGLDRLVERCEKATKQRNVRSELYSTQLLWNSFLNETRKTARERGALAEFYNTEMQAMLDIMMKDLHLVTKKCKEYCIETQDKFLKELKELMEAMKAYQYSSHNTQEALNKLCRSKDKLDAAKHSAKGSSRRKEHLESKELERQQQYKENQQRLIKFRNDYLLCLHSCNAYCNQYFNKDLLELIEQTDYDYHGGLHRVAESYRETEHMSCRTLMSAADALFDQANQLSFDGDLQLFLKENGMTFMQPPQFTLIPYGEDAEQEIQLTEALYHDVEESMKSSEVEAQALEVQIEEESKTLQHMTRNVLEKYKIVPMREPPPPEEPADSAPSSSLQLSSSQVGDDIRKTTSLERSSMLAPQNVRLQMFHNAQRGKREDINFTLNIFHRKLQKGPLLSKAQARYTVLKQAIEKAPPAAFASGIGPAYHLKELPKLFGGDLLNYIEVTMVKIPLIVTSCCQAIETRGVKMEGLFRVPGPAQHIEELRKDFEEGKNPFNTPGKEKYKTDVAAIASTLKAYFRELQTPLFPVEKYSEFTACARRDSEERCTAIKTTVNNLHPFVVNVMAYLFNFLYKVSQHSLDNKMSSSNLALVFGPTLVRAPPHLDAIQLHNDVPAVNMLIQVCIDHHDMIFTTVVTPPPPPVTEEGPRPQSVSPPPVVTVSNVDNTDTSDHQQQPTVEESSQQSADEEARQTSPSPQITEQDIQQVLETMSPDVSAEQQQQAPPSALPALDQPQEVAQVSSMESAPVQQPPTSTQEENSDVSKQEASVTTKLVEDESKEEEEDDVSDLDSDDDEDVSTMTVKAIYNYNARNQKELSFSVGDILQVTEKTSDGNWWDGFHDAQRGYIPVAYVEIMEVRVAVKSPLPPARRSSTQVGVAEVQEAQEIESVDGGPMPDHDKPPEYLKQQSAPVVSPVTSDTETPPQPEQLSSQQKAESSPVHQPVSPVSSTQPVTTAQREQPQPRATTPENSTFKPDIASVQSATQPSRAKEVPTPSVPKPPTAGIVKNKMAQFLSSSQPHQTAPSADMPARPPSPGHRRMKSEGSNLEYKSVKQLSQAYNPEKPYPPPPVTKPKPRPSAELTRNKEVLEQAINFPIKPHQQGVTQVSPLQQKLLAVQTDSQQQQQQPPQNSKPALLTKPKGSFRGKTAKKITKPAPTAPPQQSVAPPRGAFVSPPTSNPRDTTALHEEMLAKAKARKTEKDTTV